MISLLGALWCGRVAAWGDSTPHRGINTLSDISVVKTMGCPHGRDLSDLTLWDCQILATWVDTEFPHEVSSEVILFQILLMLLGVKHVNLRIIAIHILH